MKMNRRSFVQGAAMLGAALAVVPCAGLAFADEKKEEAAPAAEAPAAEAPAEEAEAVDETGLNPDDITFVIEQTKCTRAAAVKALRDNDNDMINAVMSLSK